MTGGNLTRDEAAARAALIGVDGYRVELDLTTGDATFRSRSVIAFRCAEPGASTFLDLLAPAVHRIELNGVELDPAEVFDGSRIALTGLRADNEVTVEADCAYSRTGEGLHRFVDPVDGEAYTYTQFEPADARRLYANFEQPDLKASFAFTVTAPKGWLVRSNSVGSAVPDAPDARDAQPSTTSGTTPITTLITTPISTPSTTPSATTRWEFERTKPISTYITAIVAGPYHYVEDHCTVRLADGSALEIPLGAGCRKSLAEYFDADAVFDVTKRGFAFFHEIFDYPYPFGSVDGAHDGKYDQFFVPEYNLGAMENPGCVTFNEAYVFRSKATDAAYQGRANTILHEMAHMWFGDLVTMKWWDDLWLKESFADFMGAFALVEATRWTGAWVSFASGRKAWAYRQDQLPTTHPITADIRNLEDAKLNFDGITYAKGASVLKQLVAYVGRDAFLAGARRYFAANAYGNTTLGDLLSALEVTSGRDLADWSSRWLQVAGVSTLRPEYELAADGAYTGAWILQTAPEEWPTLRAHRIAVGCYRKGADGALELADRFELDVDGAVTDVPQLAGRARYDLVILNDLDLTYAKVRFDDADLAVLADGGLGTLADPMARTLCWSGLWHMARDGVLTGRDFIDIVTAGIARETDIGVVQVLLRQIRQVRDHYLAPEHRTVVGQDVGAVLWGALHDADPGSDHQLAYAYAVAWGSTRDLDLERLADLLDGNVEIGGLHVDQDLRWAYVEALAAVGRDDAGARTEAEVARDDTAAGRRHRASALAARPLAEAKAQAWRLVVETPDQPNDLIEAVLDGFAQPGQEKLLAPYVEPYFDGLAAIWSERSIQNAGRIVSHGYPGLPASPESLSRTDAWLASEAAGVPALRRLVLEARDDAARALRAQECDRAAG